METFKGNIYRGKTDNSKRKKCRVNENENIAKQAIRTIKDEMESSMHLTEINHLIEAAPTTITETTVEKLKIQRKRKRKKTVYKETNSNRNK